MGSSTPPFDTTGEGPTLTRAALDPAQVQADREARRRRYHLRDLPRARMAGLALLGLVMALHGLLISGSSSLGAFLGFAGAAAAYCALSWSLLSLAARRPEGRGLERVQDACFVLDGWVWNLAVLGSGAERSWIFAAMLVGMAGVTATGSREIRFACTGVVTGYGALLAWAHLGLHHPLTWGVEGTKVFILLGSAGYVLTVGRLVDRLREQKRTSLRISRHLNLQLQEQARALSEANRIKSAFLAATSHDLRTPLNAILAYSQLLQAEAKASGQARAAEDLGTIHAAGRHLLQLLNDLLDLAKVEAGKMTFFYEPLDLDAFLEELRTLAAPLAAQNGNALVVARDPAIQGFTGDATRLRQILLNLLGNAAKFTERGTITLSLAPDGAGGAAFEVRDTGIGMTPEQQGRLFQEYVQAEETTTKRYGGTGLGLALCRRLCTLMGGAIEVRSEPGRGSAFTVRMPSHEPTALPEPPAAPATGSARKALVIDDDLVFRVALAGMLAREGFEVIEAEDGETGLARARSERPSLITLDVEMPGLDGWTVLRSLKQDPATAAVPVILVTLADDRRQGFALGATDYLPKPVEAEKFQSVVRRLAPPPCEVLLVEDDGAQRQALGRVLQGAGWRVREACDGREALAALEAGPRPDLVILDIRMPHMDGFEFMDRLRAQAAWRTLPVVVLTSEDLGAQERRQLAGHQVGQVLSKHAHPMGTLLGIVRDLALEVPPPEPRA